MNQRKKAACLLMACIIAISSISIFIKEVCNKEVQTSSFCVDNKAQKVIIIVADYMELQNLKEDEYMSWFLNNSYLAFMSSRQSNKPSISKTKLSIGSGKRLEINSDMKSAMQQESIIYDSINRLKQINCESEYVSYIGYIGNELNRYNKRSCLIGNSDTIKEDRSTALLIMDEQGLIDAGEIVNTMTDDSSFPGGKRSDYNRLLQAFNKYSKQSDLIVIDTGDLARLEYYRGQLTKEIFENHKKETISNISKLIKAIEDSADQDTLLMLLSAYPSRESLRQDFKLTPALIHDKTGGGMIYSTSTRRQGIISALDIADFILEKLNCIQSSKLINVKSGEPLNQMLKLKKRLLSISTMRLPVLTWYAIFEILCAISGLAYMLCFRHRLRNISKYIKITMLANIVAPAVLLYFAVLDINNPVKYFAACIAASYTLAAMIYYSFRSSIIRFLSAASFVNFSLAFDLLRSSTLIKNSIFGYDPIIGARFYGIGNEFAGVFIGSGILLAGCIFQRYKDLVRLRPRAASFALSIYIILQLAFMGMPFLGANFGGTIAAVTGCFVFYSFSRHNSFRPSKVIALLIIMLLVLSSILIIEILNPQYTTHIGRFIKDVKDNGLKVLAATAVRKAAMNLRLMKYTIWTKVLLCIILILAIMFFKPVRMLHGLFKKYRYFTAAWIGISAGSIAGLIANDSGIVMAATAMIFTGYTILYFCLDELDKLY